MPDKVPMAGYDKQKGGDASIPDGVNSAPPGADEGKAYPNPYTDADPDKASHIDGSTGVTPKS